MPKSALDDLPRLQVRDRQEWRRWLAEHHTDSPGVWLVYHKKHAGIVTVTYEEAVEEALCFGWIDSKAKSLDADRTMLVFTPRRPGGNWSASNKERVERLVAQGLMAEAGLAAIEAAKADGSWTFLDSIEALLIPEDLAAALAANPVAQRRFEAFNDSTKKMILYHIKNTKRPATRAKRIEETVRLAEQNRWIGQD